MLIYFYILFLVNNSALERLRIGLLLHPQTVEYQVSSVEMNAELVQQIKLIYSKAGYLWSYLWTIVGSNSFLGLLIHLALVPHICVCESVGSGSDNGLLPIRRQAIIWTKAGILLIGPIGTNFNEISIEILIFSFKQMRLNESSAKWRPFCPGGDEWTVMPQLI